MNCYQLLEWGKPLQQRLLEVPVPQGAEVLVKIEAAGVCHSDLHIRDGYFDLGGGRRLTAEQFGSKLPLTMGHEMAGIVAARGLAATGPDVGTKVVVYRGLDAVPASIVWTSATPTAKSSAAWAHGRTVDSASMCWSPTGATWFPQATWT